MSNDSPPRGSFLRAGRAVASALFIPSGARWARPRRGIPGLILAGLLVVGLGVGYVAGRASGDTAIDHYLVKHPEAVRDAEIRLERRRIATLVNRNRAQLETPYAGAWEGASKPDVTLVAFMDYACGYCRATVPTISRLLKEDRNLRVVYRELPVITEASIPVARVSLYAAEQGRFPAFHAAMYAEPDLDYQTVLNAARKAGLDEAQVRAALENKGRDPNWVKNVRLANTLEAQGTPLLIVGDEVFYGTVGYDRLKQAIAQARGRAS